MQRIEDCPCLVLRGNIDDAFSCRFQSLVDFTRPDADQRERLWHGALVGVPVAADLRIERLARDHELVGGAIVNVVRHAAITVTVTCDASSRTWSPGAILAMVMLMSGSVVFHWYERQVDGPMP